MSKMHSTVWLRLLSCSLLIFVLMACSNSTGVPASSVPKGSSQASSPTVSPTPKLGAPGCHPPSPGDQSNLGFPEVQGTATGTELWALLLGGEPNAGEDLKIIWRATDVSTQEFHVMALGPHGLNVQPLFGPQLHAGSNWNRPGGEWGTGFNFPVAGCWDLHVTDGTVVGDVWIIVSP